MLRMKCAHIDSHELGRRRNMKTNFSTAVGEVTLPSDMKMSDLVMDPGKYSYEGNWAFCRFNHPHLLGGRIGFSRGEDSSEDIGWDTPDWKPAGRDSHYRIEILSRDGGYLYSYSGDEQDITIRSGVFSHAVHGADRELLSVEGYPEMHWKMASPEGSMDVDVMMEPLVFVTLPDNIQKNTTFSMWLVPCRLHGQVTIDGKTEDVQGTAFLDHPRLKKQNNSPREFGCYLYTPVLLDDGTYFFSYYADFIDGEQNKDYSFGYHVDANLNVSSYRCVSMRSLQFTGEHQVERADMVFANDDAEIHLSIREEYLPVKRAWGSRVASMDKRKYIAYPQLFTAEYAYRDASGESRQPGRGLLEYVQSDKRQFSPPGGC